MQFGTERYASWALVFLVGCVGDAAVVSEQDASTDGNSPGPDTSVVDAAVDTSVALSNVNGKVIDRRGQPVLGASVRVGGVGGKTTTTDATGSFTLLAPPTYDLSIAPGNSAHSVTSLFGLSRRDPKVSLSDVVTPSSSMTIGGSFPGAVSKPPGAATYGFATTTGSLSWGYATVTNGAYTAANADYVGPSTSGNVDVLVANSSQGEGPYLFGTSGSVGLVNGGVLNNVGLMASSPTETAITGTIATAGGNVVGLRKQITLSPGVGLEFAFDVGSVSFNTKFPAIGGATFSVDAVVGGVPGAAGNAWAFASGLKPQDPPVALVIPSAPLLNAPAASAVGVDAASAKLQWSGKGVSVVTLRCTGDAGAPANFTLVVMSQTLSLPNDPDLGVPVPAGAQCGWSVTSLTAFADVNDVAENGFASGRPSGFSTLLSRTGAEISSPARTFTLK